MKKALFPIAIIPLMLCLILALPAKASSKLDEIENYKITVDMQKDGTMNLAYHIDWKVLDSTSEGPLTWVEIGIPNQYADNLTAASDNISGIKYYSDGGDFVRIDFKKSYYAGETASFDFKIHQSHMYTLDDDSNLCSYSFTPGWFDDIDVKSLTILWNGDNVKNSDATGKSGNYLMWNTSLDAGEKYSVAVNYNMGVFETSEDGQADSGIDISVIICAVFIIALIVTAVWAIIRRGGGGYRGGFGTRPPYMGRHVRGGVMSCACASNCACACACACAGGGRAGCSAKNFYGAAIYTEKMHNALKKKNKLQEMAE